MLHTELMITLACIFGFFMAWGIGANDVSNAMATSVGSRAITLKQAVIIAAIFEFLGAFLAGGQVTSTIRGKIIDLSALSHAPELLVFGMLSALLASGIWLLIASYRGWPVSTTHSIVGALIGFGVMNLGVKAIYWREVIPIILSWIVTPLIAGIFSYGIFRSIQELILNHPNPLQRAQQIVPFYVFIEAFVISVVTLTTGLKHLGLEISTAASFLYAMLIALMIMLLSYFILGRIRFTQNNDRHIHFVNVERLFGVLMLFTASAMAFAHGSNDVANAIGPLAAIVDVIQSGGMVGIETETPRWMLLLGGIGIVIGLATFGYRVIATIGTKITELTPTRGFAAELATATTVVLASGTGLPISTTQTLVGAVLGVGLARGIGALQLNVIRGILLSWVVTLPAGAGICIVIYTLLRWIF
ncbi:MAG: phosphate transporter [Gammaproteobacteria bacterium]|nr:phosphate transporter [Gammaproteobacteria bacterium]